MFLALIFLPLLNAMIAGFGGRWLGRKGACALTITGMLITLLTAYYHFVFTLVTPTVYHLKLGTWISSELLNVTWFFTIDPSAATMFFLTLSSIFAIYRIVVVADYRTSNLENPTKLGSTWVLLTITSRECYRYPSPPPNPNFVHAAAANPPVNVPVVPPVIPNVAPPMPAPLPPSPPAIPGVPHEEIMMLLGCLLVVAGLFWLSYKDSSKEKQSSLLNPEPGNGEYTSQLNKITTVTSGSDIDLSVIPFICITGSLNEAFMTLFLALLRRGFIYLVGQQIAGFWKVLLCCKIRNAHFRFLRTTLTKNLSKFRLHSQGIIIKTKVVILQTANQILQVLKKW